ncbi:hypothetical protein [Glaciecola sp. MF2-115]|uniref:hypothetical protein n=1 Tax=Glaciecola sp. MF2-115 TaxID=3384827 RepID=UPI0039A1C26D
MLSIKSFIKLCIVIPLISLMICGTASAAYIVGGASTTITSGSGCWAWDRECVEDFRAALENPAYFGPAGIVNETITTTTLSSVVSSTLSGIDMFIAPWVSDADASLFSAEVVSFFLSGGDLFLLQDDSSHDGLGEALGITTSISDGSVSNGGPPLFDGPFGTAFNVEQFYSVGQLNAGAISALNGTIGGINTSGQVTSAFWNAGDYAPGAGRLFVIADVDMIATTDGCGDPICGGDYTNLNDNAIYGLNTFSFISGTAPPVLSAPSMLSLFGLGLLIFAGRRSFKR